MPPPPFPPFLHFSSPHFQYMLPIFHTLSHHIEALFPPDRMKRLFTGRSSGNVDSDDRNSASQPLAGADPSRSKFSTAGYPLGDSDRQRLGGFLEHCGYCRKLISNNSDVFMYGDLRAFCSAECRDKQIARDQSLKGKQEKSKGKK